jgi:hypothetical protein
VNHLKSHKTLKKISENGYSLVDILKNLTDENIHSEISTGDRMGIEIW